MKRTPRVKSVMTPFPYTVERRDSLAHARGLMAEHGIRHLPVTDGHDLVGILSDRDIGIAMGAAGSGINDLRVADIYVPDAYVVDLEEPLDNVLVHMANHHIGSALVTHKGHLAGVFTATDACRHFAEHLRGPGWPAGGGGEVA